MNNLTTLQNFILPGLSFSSPDDLYIRGKYSLNRLNQSLYVSKGNGVYFDTFFNSISVQTWKNTCGIDDLCLKISGNGNCNIEICHSILGNFPKVLCNHEILLSSSPQIIPIKNWKSLTNGLIFLRLYALSDCKIEHIAFCSNTPQKSSPKLGVVITHFNRQEYVLNSIKRINDSLLKSESNITLLVVDNSRNLDTLPYTNSRIKIIKNKNLGGAGGFARGLLYLKNNGFTHCCFMDDDASCEIEAIRRTLIIFSYLSPKTQNDISISGILLKEDQPNIVNEAGAMFYRGRVTPICANVNISNFFEIEPINRQSLTSNYGAWCYFAFDISAIKQMPYPFFVRGDDIYFSLSNKLKIMTINGICTWIDDFSIKESPLTRYLGFRSSIIIPMLQSTLSLSRFLKLFNQWHRSAVLSYNYGSAKAIELAVMSILKGPESLVNDMEGNKFREIIKPLQVSEALITPLEKVAFEPVSLKYRHLKNVIRIISLNGLLLPSSFFKKTIVQRKAFSANTKDIFLSKEIFYLDEKTGKGYIAKYNKIESIKRIATRIILMIKIIASFKLTCKKFNRSALSLTTEEFWKEQFTDN